MTWKVELKYSFYVEINEYKDKITQIRAHHHFQFKMSENVQTSGSTEGATETITSTNNQ